MMKRLDSIINGITGHNQMQKVMEFYKGKRVFLTGHTGFKGTWMTRILLKAGAEVLGYSLDAPTVPNLFSMAGLESFDSFHHHYGDVRDFEHLKEVMQEFRPEIVFHLAAQPIVRNSYKDPRYTYEVNVMGTVNVCECVRLSVKPEEEGGWQSASTGSASATRGVRSFLNVTTDKVYLNREWCWGYREDEPLDGYDPYSNSKSCSELVTHAYINSFMKELGIAVSTARAGNVIGGGDFGNDRIIPDCVRAIIKAMENQGQKGEVIVRNANSIRPYQHILDPLFAYLMIAKAQYEDASYCGYYNVGPDETDCASTGYLAMKFANEWGEAVCEGKNAFPGKALPLLDRKDQTDENAPHESSFLKLDCSKLKSVYGWHPVWNVDDAIRETVLFTKAWLLNQSISDEMDREMEVFIFEST